MDIIKQVKRNPVVEALIQDLASSPADFKADIALEDEMYGYVYEQLENENSDRTLVNYYSKGQTIFESLKQIIDWYFQDFSQINSFLEFACGYGRLTRFLIEKLSPQKIWVSDIYEKAIQFQEEYFKVNGIVSASNPEDYTLSRQFDCIFVCSFFSHIPEKSFTRWMQKLYDLLDPEGLLIFSVLDESRRLPFVEMDASGILFSPQSESQSLDYQEYGTTFVSETFVRTVVDKASQGKAQIHRIKQGIGLDQDIYIVTPQTTKDFSNFQFNYHPQGYLDQCEFNARGDLQLSGWVADFNPFGKVEEIQILLNGEVIQRCVPSQPRPDVAEQFQNPDLLHCGWECWVKEQELSPKDVILIKAMNTLGLSCMIDAGVIDELMGYKRWNHRLLILEDKLRTTEAQLEQSQGKLLETEENLGKTQAQLESAQLILAQTQNRIQAMESSKFWELRKKWFQFKQAVGLPHQD